MQLSDKALKLVSEHLKDHQKRLTHILGVKEMTLYLAQKYNVDLDLAESAALMHDYSKYDSYDEAAKYLTKEELDECYKYPFMLHAYLSAYKYKELISDNKDSFNAIYNHVFGRPNMSTLEKIIMISDYTEKNRTYPDCIEVRKILLDGDMDLAIYESLIRTIKHCESEGKVAHPRQLEVLKEYEERIKNR